MINRVGSGVGSANEDLLGLTTGEQQRLAGAIDDAALGTG
jgi:hypothetical protein